MSYRLVDANAIADSYPEVNDMPCIYADLPRGLDGGHYDMREMDENAKLRGWWTHDGTWHVELPRLPEGIAVTMPDGRDREVRSARVWRYEPARTAKRVVVSNHETDHATGHCACGACGGAIDFFDAYCRHCGANLEEDA